ncbi:MAG: nickel-dependent lactate racemase [Dehalococcoidales bacterium]|nr:nickel-dependent lactate racemase [Dehalococcoidales bacterium]
MKIRLAYGRQGLDVDLPDENVTVVEPRYVEALPNPDEALRAALRQPHGVAPLQDLVSSADTVAIVFSDITRPTPNRLLLPALLGELAHVPRENIVLINALGMHRHNTREELVPMLGEEIVAGYRVLNHEAYDKEHLVHIGRTSFGSEAWVNREYLRASVRILTGFIEPHLFAGFSGGGKAVLPGIAGGDTVMRNHNAEMIGNPKATYGVTKGNPIFAEMREVALLTKPTFLLNVTLNRNRQITGVFAGDLLQAQDAGIEFVRRTAMRPVAEPFDVVVTTNNYYPADLDLYQSVKGMKAATQVARPGGAIVIAAGCEEGVGHGPFGEILKMRPTPEAVLEMIHEPAFSMYDQWEAQVLCDILRKQRIFVYSEGLTKQQIEDAHLVPIDDVSVTVRNLVAEYGPGARICVLPEGPQTIPYLADRQT